MNWNTHFYLYAKGHYMKTDVIEDLKKIFAKRSSIPLECCQVRDVTQVLLGLAWKHITESGNPEHYFVEFISRLNPVDIWGQERWSGSVGFWKILLADCLSVLRLTKAEGLDLGTADPAVLPLEGSCNKLTEKDNNV